MQTDPIANCLNPSTDARDLHVRALSRRPRRASQSDMPLSMRAPERPGPIAHRGSVDAYDQRAAALNSVIADPCARARTSRLGPGGRYDTIAEYAAAIGDTLPSTYRSLMLAREKGDRIGRDPEYILRLGRQVALRDALIAADATLIRFPQTVPIQPHRGVPNRIFAAGACASCLIHHAPVQQAPAPQSCRSVGWQVVDSKLPGANRFRQPRLQVPAASRVHPPLKRGSHAPERPSRGSFASICPETRADLQGIPVQ
jgi:hypothetical protein